MIRPLVSHVNGLMVHYAGVRGDFGKCGNPPGGSSETLQNRKFNSNYK